MAAVSNIMLNSGHAMPQVGLGTWKSAPDQVRAAVEAAISAGYRHVDCAAVYCNEAEVGQAIHAKLTDGTLTRDQLFVTSKLWSTKHRPENVKPALEATLSNLQISYLDMYLIHWPVSLQAGSDLFPIGPDGLLFDEVDLLDTWKAMEECVRQGLVRSIGVSNFNEKQMQYIIDNASIKPSTNQFEVHPFLDQTELIEFCRKNDVAVSAYSPFASPDREDAKATDPKVFENETILGIAKSIGKSPAQVVIRYLIQKGCIVLPKSVTVDRIKENIQVFDFSLSESDMDTIFKLNSNFRAVAANLFARHPNYPWTL